VLLVLDSIVAATEEGAENASAAKSAAPATSARPQYPAAPSPANPTLAPATATPTAPPGGRTLFCSRKVSTGSPYYVQLVTASTAQDMCTAPERTFTQEEFQGIPGLTRQCVFDRAESIAQKHSTVTIYSDETPGSVNAALRLCTNAAY
jgi:hypothetical protein